MLDIIRAYENYLIKVKQASENTISSYMRDIRQFSEWLQEGGISDAVNATQVNIQDYLAHLLEQDEIVLIGPNNRQRGGAAAGAAGLRGCQGIPG